MADAMTDERLAEIRRWVDLHGSCPGDAYDLLLAEVDRLRAADAETVAALVKLVDALPKCDECQVPAAIVELDDSTVYYVCEACSGDMYRVGPVEWAKALQEARVLLERKGR